MTISLQGEFGQRVRRRLEEERVIWLTTVDSRGTPQPRPVWFLWDGETFLVFSRPETAKIRHIQSDPQVALHLDSDGRGGDIVVFTGTAAILETLEDQAQEAYRTKYTAGFERIKMTAEVFFSDYSVAIQIRPHKVRGH